MRTAARARALPALALAAVVLAGGCTSDDAPEPEGTPAPTEQAGGRFDTPADLGAALRDAALEAGSASGTVAARSPGASLDADVEYDFSDPDVRLAAQASVAGAVSADVAVVLSDGEVYVEVPALYRLFTSASWAVVPRDASSEVGQQVDELVEALAAELPGTSLLDIDDRADDVEMRFLGDDTLDGQPVERYEVTATIDDVEVSRTYWLGADDLLQRLDSTADDPAAAEPSVSVATYDDWGVPVIVQTPDPADVTTLPEGFF